MAGHVWQGMCGKGGCAWQGVCVAGGIHGRKAYMAGGRACVAGKTAIAVGGTHPTGMHSSSEYVFGISFVKY